MCLEKAERVDIYIYIYMYLDSQVGYRIANVEKRLFAYRTNKT